MDWRPPQWCGWVCREAGSCVGRKPDMIARLAALLEEERGEVREAVRGEGGGPPPPWETEKQAVDLTPDEQVSFRGLPR